jgi:predicted phosphodiesterase
MMRFLLMWGMCGVLMVSGCASRSSFSFGVISDVHYADKDKAGTRDYRAARGKLARCVEVMNGENLAFVIQLGDLIDGGERADEEMREADGVYAGIRTKRYNAVGNHDFTGANRDEVLEALGMERGYYDFEYDRWRFVVLDTMDVSVGGGWAKDSTHYRMGEKFLGELKKAGVANAQEWNGAVGPGQKVWLEDVLKDASRKKQKVIVFGHHPLKPEGDKYTLWNSGEIAKVLEGNRCVAAYINGHKHRCEYHWIGDKYYVTMDGMVEDAFEKGYTIVAVYKDRIDIVSTGDVPRLTLPLEAWVKVKDGG